MQIIYNHWESFVLVLLVLVFLTYSMVKIKNEKDDYHKFSVPINFGDLKLKIPSWWTISHEQSSYLSFYRSDTYYEWEAIFLEIDSLKDEFNLKSYLENYLEQRRIELDSEKSYSNLDQFAQSNSVRVEGMGTEKIEKRIYLDLAIILHQKKIYLFESKSSVLNGGIEGPYFDEIIKNLSIVTKESKEFDPPLISTN